MSLKSTITLVFTPKYDLIQLDRIDPKSQVLSNKTSLLGDFFQPPWFFVKGQLENFILCYVAAGLWNLIISTWTKKSYYIDSLKESVKKELFGAFTEDWTVNEKSPFLRRLPILYNIYSPQMFEANLKPTLFFFLLSSSF